MELPRRMKLLESELCVVCSRQLDLHLHDIVEALAEPTHACDGGDLVLFPNATGAEGRDRSGNQLRVASQQLCDRAGHGTQLRRGEESRRGIKERNQGEESRRGEETRIETYSDVHGCESILGKCFDPIHKASVYTGIGLSPAVLFPEHVQTVLQSDPSIRFA